MKNKMMRIASILMVAVLLTVCAVSGTFAKYVTTADASDTARVAKWGIVITQEGDGLFATQYAADDDTYNKGEYTVISSTEEKVVAPGTTNAKSPLKFSITGTPEVAVRVKVELAKGYKEVVLPAGTYTDYTIAQKATTETPTTGEGTTEGGSKADTASTEGTFTLSEAYYPVVFKLYEGEVTDTATPIAEGKLADIETFLNTYSATADYAPGTKFNTNFSLIWEWKFEKVTGTGDAAVVDKTIDAADTFLGNIAAGVVAAPTGACTDINFSLTITVTQID